MTLDAWSPLDEAFRWLGSANRDESAFEDAERFERSDSAPLPIHPSFIFRGPQRLPVELVAA